MFLARRTSRKFLDKWIDKDKAVSPEKGFGAVFIIGDKYNSAVHSEPPIHEERLFIGLIPGSTSEVDEIRRKLF